MIRTYKRKLKPTQAQEERIARWLGACRCVYNLGLEIKIAAWKNQRTNKISHPRRGWLSILFITKKRLFRTGIPGLL